MIFPKHYNNFHFSIETNAIDYYLFFFSLEDFQISEPFFFCYLVMINSIEILSDTTNKDDTQSLTELSSKNLELILQKKKSKLLEQNHLDSEPLKLKDSGSTTRITAKLMTPTRNHDSNSNSIHRRTPGKENIPISLTLIGDSKEVNIIYICLKFFSIYLLRY